jgi:coenzyme PQQ biosynthesis probable peptidase PqqF
LRGRLPDPRAQIAGLVFNWLTFFKAHYRQLLNEYALLEQRRLAVSGALSLARHYSAETAGPGLTPLAVEALDALLASLTPQTLLQPVSQPAVPGSFSVDWCLPAPNPFLRPASAPVLQASALPSFTFSDDLPADGEATVYLRWTLVARQPKLALMLGDGLKALIADAQQAGVGITFTAYGDYWQLKLSGLADPLPAVLEQAMRLLGNPDIGTLARYGQPSHEPAPIPIRQLLRTLPDHYLNSAPAAETDDLQRVWQHARWIGFATGLNEPDKTALIHAMRTIPGKADEISPQPPARSTAKRWQTEPSASGEDAVLVFYPTPTTSVEDEAVWRFFAHILQAPFYQRLRVELQLGYAVFSGFRQIAGQGGLLFGVQSPSASATQLVDHIEVFVRTLPDRIREADLAAQILALKDQLDPAIMDNQQVAEVLWQAHQAGHGADYLKRLQHSLALLQIETLCDAASRIAAPGRPCIYLSNRSGPDGLLPVLQ